MIKLTPRERRLRLKTKDELREINRLAKQRSRNKPETKKKEKAWRQSEVGKAWLKAYHKEYGNRDYAKEAQRNRQNARYANSAEFRKRRMEYQRNYMRGMSPQMFEALLEAQGGKCAICECVLKGGKHTHADHCHVTDTPRGLLCTYCNLIEGMITNVKLSPLEFGQRLHKYLLSPPASQIS